MSLIVILNHSQPVERSIITYMSEFCIIIITSTYADVLVVEGKFSYGKAQPVTEHIQEPHQVASCFEQSIKIHFSYWNYFLLKKKVPNPHPQTYKQFRQRHLETEIRLGHIWGTLWILDRKVQGIHPFYLNFCLEKCIKRRIREEAPSVSVYNFRPLITDFVPSTIIWSMCRKAD